MTLSWDQKGRLTGVLNAPGGDVTYTYDALNRRVSKTVAGTETKYLYDGLNMVAELDGSLARIDNSTGAVHYYHADILGSVVALTNSSGGVSTRYNYSPFGTAQVIGEDVGNPYRFVGKVYDPETGFIYFPYRYYSDKLGRFVSEDPIRFKSGEVNWYVYAKNNPINYVDPLGLNPVTKALKCLYGLRHCKECKEKMKDCTEKHKDPNVCRDRKENIEGGLGAHMLSSCLREHPECEACALGPLKCF
jgi:RHS repeat-associated protein